MLAMPVMLCATAALGVAARRSLALRACRQQSYSASGCARGTCGRLTHRAIDITLEKPRRSNTDCANPWSAVGRYEDSGMGDLVASAIETEDNLPCSSMSHV